MFACSVLTCAFAIFHAAHDNANARQELVGHTGSDELVWIQECVKRSPVHIRGPVWSHGVELHQTKTARVWAVPGPSSLGTTVGVGVTVDF